jgi:hypothetical protein
MTLRLRILLPFAGVADQRSTHASAGAWVFSRFNYIYLRPAARNRPAEDITDAVMDRLRPRPLQTAWGQGEYDRLSQNAARLADLGPRAVLRCGPAE